MDLSINKTNRRNIIAKNICMEPDLKISQNTLSEHVPTKPNIFNTNSNFNVFKVDESYQVRKLKNSLVNKNAELSITDLSKDERIIYERKNVLPNRFNLNSISTPTHKNITEIEVNTLGNEDDVLCQEQKYLPPTFKEPVLHPHSSSLNNIIIMKSQNSSSSHSFHSNFNKNCELSNGYVNKNPGLNSGYMSNYNDKNMLVLLKQKQLEAKVQELRIAEEKIIKQEEEARIKTWQALQEQEAALFEKEKTLKFRELAAQKKYEEAVKIIEESRKLSTSSENLSYIDESPKHIRNHSSKINPNNVKCFISDNVNKRKFEKVVPGVMLMSPQSTNGSIKHFMNTPYGNTFYLHSSNQPPRAVEKEPPRKMKVLDIYGVKPSINPSKILHTYSRTTPKKFNGTHTGIKSEDGFFHILPQQSNISGMNHDRPNSTCKIIKEILFSDNGKITVSELSKSENSSRPSSTFSHSQLLKANDNLEMKSPLIINGYSNNGSQGTTKIDIETNNDLINKTQVDIETTDISGNDMEVAFSEKVQKLTSGVDFQNQTADISEEFCVFTGKKESASNELSENINDEKLSRVYEEVSNESCHSIENKMVNGLQNNYDIDFDINEPGCTSTIDLFNNNNNIIENNKTEDVIKDLQNKTENNNNSFSNEYTSICSENSGYDLNEISVDPNFEDLVYKMENNPDQLNEASEMDISHEIHIQNSESNLSKTPNDSNALCSDEVSKIQNVKIGIDNYSNSEDTTDNCHDESGVSSHDYWNESFTGNNKGERFSVQHSGETDCQMKNVTEQVVSDPQDEAGTDCSLIVQDNVKQLECDYYEKTVVINSPKMSENTVVISSLETNNTITTCNDFENVSVQSSERDYLPERNNEEYSLNQTEDDSPSIVKELNIDDASIIDVNEISFDKNLEEDFQEDYYSDINNLAEEESDFEDVTSTTFKEKDKSFQPLKWTSNFRRKQYSDKLYPELRCHHMQWIEVYESEEQSFLSNCSASPLFKFQSNYYKDDSWSRINCFSGKQQGSGKLIFVGGPIRCSAWCPVPVVKEKQYIALSSVCNPDVEVTMSKSEKHKGLIQIWDCGKLNKTDLPSLALCIAHDHGVIWSLAWCPSGIYEKADGNDDSTLNRLGLLSAAFSDGVIRVYLIPHPHQMRGEKMIFKKIPEFSLIHYNYENSDLQCLKICWSQYKGHSLIAGSFTNGMVCIWNLICSSSVLRSSDTEGIKLYPINSISAHSGICSAVSFYPKTNGEHLVTGGSDRTIKFWDLSEPEHPLTVIKKGSVTDCIWIPHWSGAIFSFDDAFSIYKTSTTFRGNGFFGNAFKSVSGTNATTWNISGSDWLNAIVQGDEAGEVLVSYPKKLNCDNGSECHTSKHIFPVFSVQLQRMKDLHSQDEDQGVKSESCSGNKRRRGRKRVKSPKLTQQYDEQPLTYSSAIESYGIKFLDDDNISKPNISRLRTKQKADPMPPGPITQYPLMGASSVTWNNNYGTHTWIFIGLNSGFGRLIQLPLYKNK